MRTCAVLRWASMLCVAGVVPSVLAQGGPSSLTKWEQLPIWGVPSTPVYYGWNEFSWHAGSQIAADDWVCVDGSAVTEIRWWGSYSNWTWRRPPQHAPRFHLAIWTDVPAGIDQPWSHPGQVVWEYDAAAYTEEFAGWDYDPRSESMEACFVYECMLPRESWFYQGPGQQIYWLSIAADYSCGCNADLNGDGLINSLDRDVMQSCLGKPPMGACAAADLNCDGVIDTADVDILVCLITNPQSFCCPTVSGPEYAWGWKTRPRDPTSPAPDGAVDVYAPTTAHVGDFFQFGWPLTGVGVWDMAFEIVGQKVEPSVKWDQPPLFNPASPNPECFWGWDEESWVGGPQLAADDWVCTNYAPVTDIHWWGSYFGWDGTAPPQPAPLEWVLTMWTDHPGKEFSHPAQAIWQVRVAPAEVQETYVGCDYHPDRGRESAFYYSLVLPESNWFYQEPLHGVYWLSIAPVLPQCACNGDVNGDGRVNLADLSYLISCLGSPPIGPCAGADINCDGVIDPRDIDALQCLIMGGPPEVCCPGSSTTLQYPWGWKTRLRDPLSLAPDAAVRVTAPTAPVSGDVFTSGTAISNQEGPWDLAFKLTSNFGPLYAKWSQPPEQVQMTAVLGWDELSWYNGLQIAADDWVCTSGRPVTDVHWWGSFIGWGEPFLPGPPTGFCVSMWTDVPWSKEEEPFSHPGQVVWEAYAPWPVVQVVPTSWWDIVDCGDWPADKTFEFNWLIPRTAWFTQPTANAIYWLSIAPTYCTANPDMTGDGLVNYFDILPFYDCVGQDPLGTCAQADLNCDGYINQADVDLFVQYEATQQWPPPPAPPVYPFGWKTRLRDPLSPAPDAAVRFVPTAPALGSMWGQGAPLVCSPGGAGYDLAFVLTTCRTCGDLNCDGLTNNGDIDAFVMALTDPVGYPQRYPNCNPLNGDCNFDGLLNNGDIDSFVSAVLNGGCP